LSDLGLKNKRVLITAGPTWVPIDRVRVISNIATGQTGIFLAKELQKLGAKVTLLLGPVEAYGLDKNIKLIRFKFFDELKGLIKKELKSKKYDIFIHSAAVSDYRSSKIYPEKLKSGIKNLKLSLLPTEKLIDSIKKIAPYIFLVGFKLETDLSSKALINKTKNLIKRAKLDLAVANTIYNNQYKAFILDDKKAKGPFLNKKEMAKQLIKLIGEKLCRN
jgi:phosphopantothenoylcysteine decarboxylase/phosphopantothenate--cysteine ligase